MKTKKIGKSAFLGFGFFFLFSGFLSAQEKRSIPLDICLIIDGSALFSEGKNEAIAWINRELIDGILQEGDTLTVWSAGESAGIVHSETVGTERVGIKEVLRTLDFSGREADFTGALKEAASKSSGRNRLSVTMLVTGSVLALAPSMESDAELFRWSRIEEYSRWQVLVVAPGIGADVRRAAAGYMSRP